MKKALFLTILAAAMTLFADGTAPAYSCSLRVDRPTMERKKPKETKKSKETKEVTNTTMKWPVKVSFSGKEIPTKIELRSCFIGTRDGKPAIIGESKTDVKLDNTNAFKTTIASPSVQLTEITKQSGGRRNRKTTKETSGDRIMGCVVQLVVDDKVVRSYASRPIWEKLAKSDVLDTEGILKLR